MPAMHKIDGQDFAIGNQIDTGLKSLMADLESRDFLRGLDREILRKSGGGSLIPA